MRAEIGCREIGADCDFVAGGESEEDILYTFMTHVRQEHSDDWFSVEEIYATASDLIRRKVA